MCWRGFPCDTVGVEADPGIVNVADPTDSKSSDPVAEAALFEARSDARATRVTDEPDEPVTPPAKKGGRFVAFLSLLLSLGALALAGYLFYLQQLQDPLAGVNSRIASIEVETAQFESSLAALRTSQTQDLEKFAREQRAELESARDSLLESLQQVNSQAPPSSREWKIAEVGYLLRIANHRLLMERDADGALELLSAADVILAELDDFSFYQVRSRLAEEIRALQAVESNDLPGIYLQLEALKGELSQLPLKLPEYLDLERRATPPAEEGETGFWPALRRELASKFRIRSFDGDIKPLLSPQEAVYLELNLRLMLERAQLAALRREQLVFSQSLETAADWLTQYLDASDSRVADVVAQLQRIAEIQLNVNLPDISASLTALQALRRES